MFSDGYTSGLSIGKRRPFASRT